MTDRNGGDEWLDANLALGAKGVLTPERTPELRDVAPGTTALETLALDRTPRAGSKATVRVTVTLGGAELRQEAIGGEVRW